jgi:iron complex outermembrane receptor protein
MTRFHALFRAGLFRTAAPIVAGAALASAGSLAYAQAPAPAAPAPAADTVGEVVVTAQFREQNLQQTPLAITAMNAQMLQQRSQTDISQVAGQAPNVTLSAAGGQGSSSMVAFIRGVGQTDFNYALEPGVGVYVDDVYYATLAGSLLDLLDLDRVEILRGPQGTLAGKNSIGGAIKLYSKKPNGAGGGYLQGTYGSLNRIDIRGAADFTVVPDKLFVRLSGVSKHRDGYIDRIDYACSHPGSGLPTFITGTGCKVGTLGGQSFNAARIAARWLPTDRIEVNVAADATNDKSEAVANTLLRVTPGDPSQGGLSKAGLSLNGVPYDNRFVPYGPYSADPNHPNNPYMTYASFIDSAAGRFVSGTGNDRDPWKPLAVPPVNWFKGWGVSANIDWNLSDTMKLTSVTAYRYYNNRFSENTDGSPIGVQMLDETLKHHQWTQEVRLNGSIGKPIDYTIGGFYLEQGGTLQARVDLPFVPGLADEPTFVNQLICGQDLCQGPLDFLHGPDLTTAHTYAAFAHATWHVTDKLNISGGVRYSLEDKTYVYRRHNPDGTVPQPCPTPNAFDPENPPNCSLYGLNGTSARFPGPSGEAKRWDWRVDANYQFTPDVMGYAQVSTGYKGGGVNPRPFFVTQERPFKPETLTAYEVGLKTQFLDRRARLNLAAFYNDYNDIQLSLSSCPAYSPAPTAPCLMPANVGSAHVKGVEAETELHPIGGLEIDGSVSYLAFHYTKITDPSAGVTVGMVTPYTPTWKWSLGAQYAIPIGDAGVLTPRVDAAFQSKVYADPVNRDGWSDIPGYTTFNARLTWRPSGGDWETSLEITNFTNKLYYTYKFIPSNLYVAGTPALPRQWAITVKRNF